MQQDTNRQFYFSNNLQRNLMRRQIMTLRPFIQWDYKTSVIDNHLSYTIENSWNYFVNYHTCWPCIIVFVKSHSDLKNGKSSLLHEMILNSLKDILYTKPLKYPDQKFYRKFNENLDISLVIKILMSSNYSQTCKTA